MSERPIIAIIGRPNVGKSSLFNRFLKRRQAIVSPVSGTTRDRQYAPVAIEDYFVDIIDTAGLSGELESDEFGHEMMIQIQQAVKEADILIFVLDAQAGMTADDQRIAEIIRKSQAPTVVYINKADSGLEKVDAKLLNLGLGPTVAGSLTQRKGMPELIDALHYVLKKLGTKKVGESVELTKEYRITLAGRPNVGKSTLYNALIGDDRVIVSDIPGTTRDTIDSRITLSDGTAFIITDTAGLRRRGKIGSSAKVEQYSVLRTFKAIDNSDLVLVVVDATEGLTRGDAHVAQYAIDQKKPLITVINKTDLIDPETFNFRRFPFLAKRPMIFISAAENKFIDELLELILAQLRSLDQTQDPYHQEGTELSTPDR